MLLINYLYIRKEQIEMNINAFISNFKNHPVLFIGTGFSLRYLNNSFNWEGLLSYINLELTGNEEIFLDLKSQNQKEDGSYSYEKIASAIEQNFNDIVSKDRNGKFKEINDIFLRKHEKRCQYK